MSCQEPDGVGGAILAGEYCGPDSGPLRGHSSRTASKSLGLPRTGTGGPYLEKSALPELSPSPKSPVEPRPAMIQLQKCFRCIPLWLGCLINAVVLFAIDLLETPLPYDVHCCNSLESILFVLRRICNIIHIMGCCSLFVASFVVSPRRFGGILVSSVPRRASPSW